MPRLESYRFGRLVVNGEVQTHPDRAARTGRHQLAAGGHRLVLDDLQDVRERLAEHLVMGTGSHGRMHPDPTVEHRSLRLRRFPGVAAGLVVMS